MGQSSPPQVEFCIEASTFSCSSKSSSDENDESRSRDSPRLRARGDTRTRTRRNQYKRAKQKRVNRQDGWDTYVYRSPRSAERALVSLSRLSRRSPREDGLEESPGLAPLLLPPMGARSDRSSRSRCVGVSGEAQLAPPECRLAEVMSRLLTGGRGGVDGSSSTTIISGRSKVKRRYRAVSVPRGLREGGEDICTML